MGRRPNQQIHENAISVMLIDAGYTRDTICRYLGCNDKRLHKMFLDPLNQLTMHHIIILAQMLKTSPEEIFLITSGYSKVQGYKIWHDLFVPTPNNYHR